MSVVSFMSKQSGKERDLRCLPCAKKMCSSTARPKRIANTIISRSSRKCFFVSSISMSMILEMRPLFVFLERPKMNF